MPNMKKLVLDQSISLSGTTREVTPEGYLRVKGRVARTGVQEYLAHELGLEGNPNRIVYVYRPEEEVFAPSSLESYEDKDVTDDHPNDLVTSDSWRGFSVGHVTGPGARVDDWVDVPMLIKHKDTIAKVLDGKAELSAGYLAEYVPEPVTVNGVQCDFVQRNIRINHVAVVDAARAGREARIFDATPTKKVQPMAQRKVVLDSKRKLSVTLDDDQAEVVETAIQALEEAKDDAEKRADEAEAEAEKKDAQIEALEAKVEAMPSEEDMEKQVSDRVAQVLKVTKQARKMVKGFDSAGVVSPVEIQRAALKQMRPSKDWDSKNAVQIAAAWEFACDAEGEDKDDDEEEDGKKTSDGLSRDLRALDAAAAGTLYGHKTSDTNAKYGAYLKGEK